MTIEQMTVLSLILELDVTNSTPASCFLPGIHRPMIVVVLLICYGHI